MDQKCRTERQEPLPLRKLAAMFGIKKGKQKECETREGRRQGGYAGALRDLHRGIAESFNGHSNHNESTNTFFLIVRIEF